MATRKRADNKEDADDGIKRFMGLLHVVDVWVHREKAVRAFTI